MAMIDDHFSLFGNELTLKEVAKHCTCKKWRHVIIVTDEGDILPTSIRLEGNGEVRMNSSGGTIRLELSKIISIEFPK